MGQSLQANGALALPGAAQGTPKSAAYKGSVVLNGQALEGSIEATLTGRPNITADLKASVLDLDKIGGGAACAARARAWPAGRRGQADRHGAAARHRRHASGSWPGR